LLGLDPDGLGRIGCPVRVVTGTASRDAYAAIADALTARIHAAVHEQLADADHMAPITRPADVAASVRALVSP
jgi:pimeloyl-ACP methyl ester carboxylesterase